MPRAKTGSFIAGFPLQTTAAEEKILATRLRAAGHIYIAVLGEALRVLDLMRESKEWQAARALSAKTQKGERRAAFKAVRARFDFRSSMTDRHAIQCKNTCWIGNTWATDETQKVALRAFQAVDQVRRGRAWASALPHHRVRPRSGRLAPGRWKNLPSRLPRGSHASARGEMSPRRVKIRCIPVARPLLRRAREAGSVNAPPRCARAERAPP
ncbi:MAG TPA: hypothetical protein VMK12_28365 [Anaeromyxobacteraceae bacterium]|nr:hypothetical protein [Anaeromyxobacteraceae bacterium]